MAADATSDIDRLIAITPDKTTFKQFQDIAKTSFPGPQSTLEVVDRKEFIESARKQPPAYGFDLVSFFSALSTNELGQTLIYGDLVSSTQTIMNEKFGNLLQPLVFTTNKQVAGRGRTGNSWDSPSGCLMFTFKIQMEVAARLPLLQYLVSMAVVHAVQSIEPKIKLRLKWPNDIYSDGPQPIKVGGVLCQSSCFGNVFDLTVGVGLNVSNAYPTTCLHSLATDSGVGSVAHVTRERILASFLMLFEQYLPMFEAEGFANFEENYISLWLHSDQVVSVADKDPSKPPRQLRIKGLMPDGFLKAEDTDGSGAVYQLHPDGNSFDFLKGLIISKKL